MIHYMRYPGQATFCFYYICMQEPSTVKREGCPVKYVYIRGYLRKYIFYYPDIELFAWNQAPNSILSEQIF